MISDQGLHTMYNAILRIDSKEFSGNQGKHQNFDPSILPYKFGLIFMGMKQNFFFLSKKKFKMADSKKAHFSKSPILKNNFSDSSLGQ